jgi:hypothetical protein
MLPPMLLADHTLATLCAAACCTRTCRAHGTLSIQSAHTSGAHADCLKKAHTHLEQYTQCLQKAHTHTHTHCLDKAHTHLETAGEPMHSTAEMVICFHTSRELCVNHIFQSHMFPRVIFSWCCTASTASVSVQAPLHRCRPHHCCCHRDRAPTRRCCLRRGADRGG